MRFGSAHFAACALVTGVVALGYGCKYDPVYDDEVAALGKETPGGPDQYHRPGQPCGLCHRKGGVAKTDFSIAGTVFAGLDNLIGVDSARVDLVDSKGTSPPIGSLVITNCVGNFFVLRSDWDPAFPIAVRVTKGVSQTMRSQISRTSSCGDCHKPELPLHDPLSTVDHVYLFSGEDPAGKAAVCRIDPDLTTYYEAP
jgi:cytochrome c553